MKKTKNKLAVNSAFTREWKVTTFQHSKKSEATNLPISLEKLNKLIKSYMRLRASRLLIWKGRNGKNIISIRRRRILLRQTFVSDAEIKLNNIKAKITLYLVDREREVLAKKYLMLKKRFSTLMLDRYNKFYQGLIRMISLQSLKELQSKHTGTGYPFAFIKEFLVVKNLYLQKVWSVLISRSLVKSLNSLREIEVNSTINQKKFSNNTMLFKLSKIIEKLLAIGRKKKQSIEYNIVKLKSIAYNTDLFTQALALKLKKTRINRIKSMLSLINRAYIPQIDSQDSLLSRDLMQEARTKDELASGGLATTMLAFGENSKNEIHNSVYSNIGYKNISGIRIEVSGRLTKRYRADKSVSTIKYKGGLMNIDSTLKDIKSIKFRGNANTNISYSITKSKRRIGAFAVKGWLAGK